MSADWNITDGSYTVGTTNFVFNVAIPKKVSAGLGVISQEITNERRLQISEKPQVDGAEVEDFGRKPRMFTAEVIFFGTDYLSQVAVFEKLLNSGKSGTLILPDLEEAVYAKYQKHNRKSATQDGGSTILSVSWIEDRTNVFLVNSLRTQAQATAALKAGDTLSALPTVQDKANLVQTNIAAAKSTLSVNKYLSALQSAEGSVVSLTQNANAILNIPKKLRQDILATAARMQLQFNNVLSAVKGIQNLASDLSISLSQPSPTRFNTALSAIDFAAVDTPITTAVTGTATVVTQAPVAPLPLQTLNDAVSPLASSNTSIQADNARLEGACQGQTSDVSAAVTQLVNSVKDLATTINTSSSKTVLTTVQSSLLEVCFRKRFNDCRH